MEQSNSFHDFDHERYLRRLAIQRQNKGIQSIERPESEDWLFSTDLDNEIDLLTSKLEVNQCH